LSKLSNRIFPFSVARKQRFLARGFAFLHNPGMLSSRQRKASQNTVLYSWRALGSGEVCLRLAADETSSLKSEKFEKR
jgi:hypothetical protein